MRQAGFRTRTTGLIVGTLVAGPLITWTLLTTLGQEPQKPEQTEDDRMAVAQANTLSRAFRFAAKQVRPTVVKVRTTTRPRAPRGVPRSGNPFRGTPFEDLFDNDVPGFRWRGIPDVPQPGLGSGVIIDPKGIVLTNNHVVANADEVIVQLGDGREFKVTDIKTDEKTDLAVLRIEADETLPAARLGDSDQLEIGDWVIAIGNPFELEQTVSAGIISGKGRTLGAVRRATFLQTDAAINPGNSGGPLVNLDGQVIGINTAIFSRTGAYQGVGFAIPINIAKWVTRQLIDQGTVARAYLGVGIENITPDVTEELGVRPNAGVVVKTVEEDTPAGEAGIRENDVIVSFDGRPIQKVSDLQALVERSEADSRHKVSIVRGGKPQTLQVVVKAMPDDFERSMAARRLEGRGGTSEFYQERQLGLVVIELTDVMAERFGYDGLSGALIVHVDADKIAAQAGLRQGMLVVRVGKTPIKSVADFREAMENESLQEGITLEIHSRGGTRTFKLQSS